MRLIFAPVAFFLCSLSWLSLRAQQHLNYGSDTVQRASRKYYDVDLYLPAEMNEKPRALIIWIHGGGFVFGSKQDENVRLWCQTFAARGYVCAAINYRLGKKSSLFNFGKLAASAYPAVLDARQAVRYFRANAGRYRIDPERIILAGNSAGAMIALQAAFSGNRELADSLRVSRPEPFGDVDAGPEKVYAVINFWGGIYNINWLNNAPASVISVYGSHDRIVRPAYNRGTYGGLAIQQRLQAMKRSSAVKVFKGYGHELHRHFNPLPLHLGGAGIKKRWLEAGQFAADFLGAQKH